MQRRESEFFAFSTKLQIMAMLASKDFTVAKKLLPVGFYDHWIESLMLMLPS